MCVNLFFQVKPLEIEGRKLKQKEIFNLFGSDLCFFLLNEENKFQQLDTFKSLLTKANSYLK